MSFDRLVDETANLLRSFVRDQELATWLTSPVAVGAREILVKDPKVLSRGRVEIGSELIVLEEIDASRNAGIIPPYGRGIDGTVEGAHDQGDKVTVAPLFPRQSIADAINATILATNDVLFGVENVQLRAHTTRVAYELPSYTTKVLSISIPIDPNVTRERWFAREWEFDPNGDFPSGKAIYLYDYPPVGREFQVTIATKPEPLTFGDDWVGTGLPDSCRDVMMYGAVSRLLATTQSYALATRAVGAQTTLGQDENPQDAQNLARHFYSLYTQRLDEEMNKQNNRYSNRIHYQRRGY